MTDARPFLPPVEQRARAAKRLARRRRAERRYKMYGVAAIAFACAMLGVLLASIVSEGYSAFTQTYLRLDVALEKKDIDPNAEGLEAIRGANLQVLIEDALIAKYNVQGADDQRLIAKMISPGADTVVRRRLLVDQSLIGRTLPVAVPAQIFIWADKPERGFQEKIAAAIIVLLAFLVLMNALAIYLRKRFERRL